MLLIRLSGGLGNQMFQYALGRRLALQRDEEIILDISSFNDYHLFKYGLDKYNIRCEKINSRLLYNNRYLRKVVKSLASKGIQRYFRYYVEKELFVYDSNVLKTKADYFLGSWQSFKYFEDISDIIANDFKLKTDLSAECMDIIQQMSAEESIALHIRRGDYYADRRTTIDHGIVSLDYYARAIDFLCNMTQNPILYIFSDDIDWVKNNFSTKHQVHYYGGSAREPEVSMYLMSKCKHNIISNSTFSWWGAWLNENPDKIIVVPEYWMRTNRTSTDLVPKEWKILKINELQSFS